MVWGDYTDASGFYRGWHVVFEDAQPESAQRVVEVLNWLRNHMAVDTVALLLPVPNQPLLAVKVAFGLEEEITEQIRIPIGQGIAGQISAQSRPLIVDDVSAVEVFSPILRAKGLRSLIGVPLALTPSKTGVLHVGSLEARQFNQRDVEQLQLVAQRLQATLLGTGWLLSLRSPYLCDSRHAHRYGWDYCAELAIRVIRKLRSGFSRQFA